MKDIQLFEMVARGEISLEEATSKMFDQKEGPVNKDIIHGAIAILCFLGALLIYLSLSDDRRLF